MAAIIPVLVIVVLSTVVTRVATVALTLTGLSREAARFQARSALTGTGFTTSESERMVGHPVRRRIVMTLMLIGSAGIVSVIATVILSFVGTSGTADALQRFGTLTGGLVLIYLVSHTRAFNRSMEFIIERALKRFTDIDVRDYAKLLRVHGDYGVSELAVEEDDWLAGCSLAELRLADEGVLVLGLQAASDTYLGAPKGDLVVRAGDVLILYGRAERLADIDAREAGRAGDEAHARAVEDQQQLEQDERAAERRFRLGRRDRSA